VDASRFEPAKRSQEIRGTDALNRRTARAYQQVLCTTAWAAAEFERIGAGADGPGRTRMAERL